jgi:hypothetical protein
MIFSNTTCFPTIALLTSWMIFPDRTDTSRISIVAVLSITLYLQSRFDEADDIC